MAPLVRAHICHGYRDLYRGKKLSSGEISDDFTLRIDDPALIIVDAENKRILENLFTINPGVSLQGTTVFPRSMPQSETAWKRG